MAPLLYSLQFRGFARTLGGGVLEARASAPAGALVTTVGRDGVASQFEPDERDEVLLESRLLVSDGVFDMSGRMKVSREHAIRFRALGRGRLSVSPDPHLRQGAIVCEIVEGEGQFARARGRITSSLLLSDTGDLTDTHLGVVFLADDAHNAIAAQAAAEGGER